MTSRLGARCARHVLTSLLVTLPIGAQEWTAEPSFSLVFSSSTGLAYDSVRARTVLVRGTETWEHDGAQWRRRNTATPTGLLGIPLLAFDERRAVVVMLVGDSSSSPPAVTWEWDGARWQRVAPREPNPPARRPAERTRWPATPGAVASSCSVVTVGRVRGGATPGSGTGRAGRSA